VDNALSHDLVLGSPMGNRGLDSTLLMSPLQLEIFCDSMKNGITYVARYVAE